MARDLRHKFILGILGVVVTCIFPSQILAASFGIQGSSFQLFTQPSSVPTSSVTDKQAQTCLKTNSSITKELQNSAKRIEKHTQAVAKKKQKWQDEVAKLEKKRCTNVARVRGDLNTLYNLYDRWQKNWVDNYTLYTAKLSSTLQISCSDDFQTYRQSIQDAKSLRRAMLAQDKRDQDAIETFLKNSVYPHIKLVSCP